MAFVNRIRLPFQLTRPQFQEERDVFRKSNGAIKVLSSVIRKRYEGETDLWPEKLHERFKIALSHDNVTVEGEKYIGGVVQDGDYTINWPDFLDYPRGKAQFFAFATPFDASNSNCGSCEDFTQVVAEDDIIPGFVVESQNLVVDVLANDSVCCEPVEITIITANTDYVLGISVNGLNNNIGMTMKDSFISQNNVVLATYRVQCENGQYDEARIIANMQGSEEACLSPVNLTQLVEGSTTSTIAWDGPDPAPACGYVWRLYLASDPGSPVQSGTTSSETLELDDLVPSTAYRIEIQSDCCDESLSNVVDLSFSTSPEEPSSNCGRYRLFMDDGTGDPSHFSAFQHYNCFTGDVDQGVIYNMTFTFVCVLQNSPGDPVGLFVGGSVDVTYMGLCE